MTQHHNDSHILSVCTLCRFSEAEQSHDGVRGGQQLLNALDKGLQNQTDWQLQPVKCMGACSHFCVVAFAAPQKLTFVFRDLSPLQSASELLKFSRQYLMHPTGTVPYRERPDAIKKKLLVVLPPPAAVQP